MAILNKRRLVNYQDSYYFRQQRSKQRKKWLKRSLFLVLVLAISMLISSFAQAVMFDAQKPGANKNFANELLAVSKNPHIHGPQLLFDHPNPAMRAALPVDVSAKVEVNGLIAYAEITQVFVNPHAIALDGKYQFPLPEDAAVKYLKIKVADKEIIGEIMEKQAAKAVFKKAQQAGKKASLVEQQRPNLFTNKIANIPPQSSVEVTLKFILPVAYRDGQFYIRLPLAMTKRYQPEFYLRSPAFFNTETIAPAQEVLAESLAKINIELNAGAIVSEVASASHAINVQAMGNDQSSHLITLQKSHTVADKSFELSWQLAASEQPQVSSFTEQIGEEYFTLLTFFPPQQEIRKTIARDIIFIVDSSGSMQGASMQQAKSSLEQAIYQLNAQDSFNIIDFDDSVNLLFSATKMATQSNINNAQQFIDKLSADGGTEMYRPLSKALMMKKSPSQTEKAIRQIVFITDGAVSNEFELMQLLDGAGGNYRLYTVGIGAAPNGYFMKKAAQFGRGSYVFIQNQQDVKSKVSALMTKISQPAVSDIELVFDQQVHQQLEVYPKHIPDLYFGEPMQVAIRSEQPISSVQLQGETATEGWYQQLIIDDRKESQGISTLWARRKIEDLLDSLVTGADKNQVKTQVIETSINHQTLSPYTSFIAVEKLLPAVPLLAKNDVKQLKPQMRVAMPKTALGWQQQLFIGLLLIILATLSHLKVRRRYAKITH